MPNVPRGPGSRLGWTMRSSTRGTSVELAWRRGADRVPPTNSMGVLQSCVSEWEEQQRLSNYGNSGRYERLLASICHLLDTDKTTKGGDMAQHLRDQLEDAQGSLPESYGADEGDGYGGGLVNIGQLRELLAARRSLDEAIKVVLMQGGRAIERPS